MTEPKQFQIKDRVRHIDGRTGTIIACPVNADGFPFVRVVFDEGGVETLESGYFERIPEAFSV